MQRAPLTCRVMCLLTAHAFRMANGCLRSDPGDAPHSPSPGDGSLYASDRVSPVAGSNGTTLHFRGRQITEALIADLRARHGLGAATDVVIGGCSAGGAHVVTHLDRVRSLLPAGAKVAGFSDSGFPLSSPTPTPPLPDEVLAVVFGYCGPEMRMMAVPAVSKRWLDIYQHQMRPVVAIGLAWAVRNRCCGITDAGLTGLVLQFLGAAILAIVILAQCRSLTEGGLEAVAAGCPTSSTSTSTAATASRTAGSRRSPPDAPTPSTSTSSTAEM